MDYHKFLFVKYGPTQEQTQPKIWLNVAETCIENDNSCFSTNLASAYRGFERELFSRFFDVILLQFLMKHRQNILKIKQNDRTFPEKSSKFLINSKQNTTKNAEISRKLDPKKAVFPAEK